MAVYKAAWSMYHKAVSTQNAATLKIARRLAEVALTHEIVRQGLYSRVEMECIASGTGFARFTVESLG